MTLQNDETYLERVPPTESEESIPENYTIDAPPAYEKDAWRQLHEDLENIGITLARFTKHRDLIMTKLLEAVKEGE
jgi:hypothetical protein